MPHCRGGFRWAHLLHAMSEHRRATTVTSAPRARSIGCSTRLIRPAPRITLCSPRMVTGSSSMASCSAPSAVGTALRTANSSRVE
ncbi:MAG: hypothetical protein PUC41_06180 [Oscillospiraceae bacterium]|nr:hypothetical protein [Oscillospiraceae bacterium]